MKIVICIFILVSCAKIEKKKSDDSDLLSVLKQKFKQNLSLAKEIRDPNKWLAGDDCDGMIWAGKYSCAASDVNIEAAEEEPGKFHRRPPPYCWTKEEGDRGAKTTWSRDMAIGGLFPFMWCNKRLDVAERHARYGNDNGWLMGDLFEDGRTLYTPQLISTLYALIYKLGGEDNSARHFPVIYPSGLVDYEAHLQMMTIWLRGELYETSFKGISEPAFNRIKEHAKREPQNPFYQFLLGSYQGNMDKAISLLVKDNNPPASYVRCSDIDCQLSEWLFTAKLVIGHFE